MSTRRSREFPALAMTTLIIVASLCSTGCLRSMTREMDPIKPSPSYLTDNVTYNVPGPTDDQYQAPKISSIHQATTRR
ncbi:MAG: hypothetical protein AAGD11_05115 [Planctomycetota bacterium]